MNLKNHKEGFAALAVAVFFVFGMNPVPSAHHVLKADQTVTMTTSPILIAQAATRPTTHLRPTMPPRPTYVPPIDPIRDTRPPRPTLPPTPTCLRPGGC